MKAEKAGDETRGDIHAVYWKLRMNGEWTVPAVELWRGSPTGTTLLVGDDGRASLAEQAAKLLAAGQRVISIDPFFFGESKIKFNEGHLYPVLMAAVGQRALGVQAAQVAAAARWVRATSPDKRVALQTEGMRTSLIALVACALEPGIVDSASHTGQLQSLDHVVRNDCTVDKYPEMFCFGLLERFDIPHLQVLAGETAH